MDVALALRDSTRIATVVMIAAALVACGRSSNVSTTSAGQNAAPQSGQTLIAAGTTFYGKLQEGISSKTSHDGDKFALQQTDTLLHKAPALHGTTIEGHLENVVPAAPLHKPGMTIAFDDVVLPDGSKTPVNVQLVSVHAFDARSHRLRTIGLMIGGAIAGHMVHKTGHAGALLGAAGGYALSQTLKTDIVVPAGTVLELRFRSPVMTASSPAQ